MEAPPSPKTVVYSLDSPSFSPRWSTSSPVPAISLPSIPVVPPATSEETGDSSTEKTAGNVQNGSSEVKLPDSVPNSIASMESETVETRDSAVETQIPADPHGNSGNSGNSGNREEVKLEESKEEAEKKEEKTVETVETENPPIEIKLMPGISNTPEAAEDSEHNVEEESETEEAVEAEEVLVPYDISLLHQILSFLIQLSDPTKCGSLSYLTNSMHIASLNYGLSMINTLLEMNGDLLASHQSLISLLQGVFCKFLIQNSRAEDTQTLSLTLRVIFNLFQSLKSFLKVQLEVFITSVHIRLADTLCFCGRFILESRSLRTTFSPRKFRWRVCWISARNRL